MQLAEFGVERSLGGVCRDEMVEEEYQCRGES